MRKSPQDKALERPKEDTLLTLLGLLNAVVSKHGIDQVNHHQPLLQELPHLIRQIGEGETRKLHKGTKQGDENNDSVATLEVRQANPKDRAAFPKNPRTEVIVINRFQLLVGFLFFFQLPLEDGALEIDIINMYEKRIVRM